MVQRELIVFAHLPSAGHVPAGRLELTEGFQGVVASSFAYGTRYLARPGSFEVDPVSLSLKDRDAVRGHLLFPVNTLPLFGGVRDAAPDAWGRRVIEAQRKVPANSLPESTYLLEAGGDRVGALDVRDALDSPGRSGVAGERSLPYLMETVERIELGEAVPSRLTDLFGSGPGAGGARPKASVRDDKGLLWLAKFASRGDTFDVAMAEATTLELARRCGLTVPRTRVVDLGGRSCLLVRRFDRYWAPGPIIDSGTLRLEPGAVLGDSVPGPGRQELRLPFVSGLTLVACDELESRSKGYRDLTSAIRRYGHWLAIRSDCQELFARMVFNILVSNDDDHLRNHGFVLDPGLGGWRLSPLYDVVPRPGIAVDRYQHLDVGPFGKLATLDNAMASHAAFDLERPAAMATMARVVREVAAWREHFEQFGVRGRLIDQLAPAFRELDEIASAQLRAALNATPPHGVTA
jgi:serine/threonine-protein kinase HipA